LIAGIGEMPMAQKISTPLEGREEGHLCAMKSVGGILAAW
jgi:hypothetical protein